MAQATSSPGGSSKTQVQAESIDSPDSESAKNHPEVTKGEESQIGNPEVSSREKRRHRASLARHSRKCSVCHHPDREFIDDDYLRWLSPKKIASQYKISHHSVVYRHADATGLRTQRRAALRATLEHFIEQAENVRVTAHSLVSAVRLYSQINDQGQYTPTPRRHIVEHHYFGLPADAGTEPPGANPAPPGDRAEPLEKSDGSQSHTSAAQGAPSGTAKVESKDGLPSTVTSAATSAAPLSESAENPPAVPLAPAARARWWRWRPASKVSHAAAYQAANKKEDGSPSNTFAAPSAAPQAKAQIDSDPKKTTGSSSPVATTAANPAAPLVNGSVVMSNAADAAPAATSAANSAAPFSESPENFPAVSVAAPPAPTKTKTTATPIATIYLQTNAISNRELLGLDHVATH